MADTAAWVRAEVAPLAVEAAVDVLDVRVDRAGARTLVRVTVDRKGGVDVGVCQSLSRRLSARLDKRDAVPGHYELQVTSPGTDRPLRDRADFDRVEGRPVLVQHRTSPNRVEQVRGIVRRAEETAVVLAEDDRELAVPYDEIVKATQALPW
ncbi:MAG: hypothetical protein H0V19_01995 [Euzebyales bacterium]|nr:hypothetical protein [Euzebyales bacterium]